MSYTKELFESKFIDLYWGDSFWVYDHWSVCVDVSGCQFGGLELILNIQIILN